jgi:hypothetical protein
VIHESNLKRKRLFLNNSKKTIRRQNRALNCKQPLWSHKNMHRRIDVQNITPSDRGKNKFSFTVSYQILHREISLEAC